MSLGFVVFILCGSGGTIYQAHSIEHTYYALLMHWPIERSYLFTQLNEQAGAYQENPIHGRGGKQVAGALQEHPGEPATAALYFVGIAILIVHFFLQRQVTK